MFAAEAVLEWIWPYEFAVKKKKKSGVHKVITVDPLSTMSINIRISWQSIYFLSENFHSKPESKRIIGD